MRHALVLVPLIFLFSLTGLAQPEVKNAGQEAAAYTEAINGRARKIVGALGLTDSVKASKIQSVISAQYRNLNAIHTDRDGQIKAVKAKGDSKEITAAAVKKLEEAATAQLDVLHREFIAALSSQLTAGQVTQVKDGLTYGVLPVTYKGYLDMIPGLTGEQKTQIMAWLTEAREHAMDAESSEKKHAWFGKYKGRINNYLSAAGYDLQKERKEWEQRIKEREEQKKAAQIQ